MFPQEYDLELEAEGGVGNVQKFYISLNSPEKEEHYLRQIKMCNKLSSTGGGIRYTGLDSVVSPSMILPFPAVSFKVMANICYKRFYIGKYLAVIQDRKKLDVVPYEEENFMISADGRALPIHMFSSLWDAYIGRKEPAPEPTLVEKIKKKISAWWTKS